MPETAKVFEDQVNAGDWRVEWFDDNGGCEVTIFSGANARDRAISYANGQYGSFEQISDATRKLSAAATVPAASESSTGWPL
jgi:hypothetical protein